MTRRPVGLAALFAVAALAATAGAVDVVIFKDGFSIKGRRFKEQQTIVDKENGVPVQVAAARGFDIVDAGQKWIIFSSRTKQVASLLDNVPADQTPKEYVREVRLKGGSQLPAYGEFTVSEFNENWKRKIHVKLGGGNWTDIEQQIERIGPTRVIMPSTTHRWYPYFDIREFDPAEVRKLLTTHPDLSEKDGKPDLGKRLAIASFMKDAGWLPVARKEIEKAKKDVPGEWSKDHTERLDKLTAEIAAAEAKEAVAELDLAVGAGRYNAARELIVKFDPKPADAESIKRFTALKAQVEDVGPRFEETKRLLRDALDDLSGARLFVPPVAVAGGAIAPLVPRATLDFLRQQLLDAGERVWAELHPDTAGRVELFTLSARTAHRRPAGQPAKVKPDELVALAVTGWLMGKNGAEQNPETAVRYWGWRQALIAYQNEDTINARRQIAKVFRPTGPGGSEPVSPDVLAQLISLLPPPQPDDLENRAGILIPPGPKAVPGLYRRNTGPLPETAKGIDYVVRLPGEYHHGRPYPVLLALTHRGVPPEQVVSLLAGYADRHGYIVAAPAWVNQFEDPYDWAGDQQYKALATLRSLLRHYRVDNDRVFAFGFADGANFAADLGASHPDLFAGVVAMGVNFKTQDMMIEYWRNYQKLPLYAVVGMNAGDSLVNLRRVFEFMMPQGFPAVANVYRGRGVEWFAGELPSIFDWMGRKKRATGTATLRTTEFKVEDWQTMREADNRFYWVGTDAIADRCLLAKREGKGFVPAKLYADIRDGNFIVVRTQGTKNVVIWLARDLVDWTKPVRVQVNGAVPRGYKPRVIQPDLDVMLEELYKHGDRSLLFLNKLEFPTVP